MVGVVVEGMHLWAWKDLCNYLLWNPLVLEVYNGCEKGNLGLKMFHLAICLVFLFLRFSWAMNLFS